MNIYNYSSDTYEFLGASVADNDPLDVGNFLIPANATTLSPPQVNANQVAVFLKDTKTWAVRDDFRNTVYWDADGNKFKISNIGDVVPSGMLSTKPAPQPEIATDKLINRVQFKSMLMLLNKSVDDVLAAIDATITDPKQNIIAKVKVTDSERYSRQHELFTLLSPSLGLTDAQIDAAWAQAVLI